MQVWIIYSSSRSKRRRTVNKNLVVVDALSTFLPGAIAVLAQYEFVLSGLRAYRASARPQETEHRSLLGL